MVNKIFNFIKKNNLIDKNSKIILGLSGGPDSVFLLNILKELQDELNFELIAAHLDHEWRANSYLDVEFCKNITQKLKIPFYWEKASNLNLNLKKTGSKEDLGRQMRRFYFEKLAKEHNADKIALAHHLNDQQETFFIRLIRGTTLTGLTCMQANEGIYIRPILEITKQEILKYLEIKNIKYLIDPTNVSPEFLRNRIRSNVIPALHDCDKRFEDNFLRTLNKLKETEGFLEKIVQEKFNEISTLENGIFQINLKQFFNLDEFLQYQILILWLTKANVKFTLTEQFLNEIVRFLKQNKSKTHEIHHEWVIEKKKNFFKITIKKLN